MVLVELVVVLVVVDLRSRDLGLSRSRDLEVVLVVEGMVVVVDFVVFVLDFVVLRVVLEDSVEEVVVEVVLFFKDLRRSLQLGFSVVVGTKFHHFLSFDGSAGVSFPRSTVATSARPDLLRNPWPS